MLNLGTDELAILIDIVSQKKAASIESLRSMSIQKHRLEYIKVLEGIEEKIKETLMPKCFLN